jgi:hypothetical protein
MLGEQSIEEEEVQKDKTEVLVELFSRSWVRLGKQTTLYVGCNKHW